MPVTRGSFSQGIARDGVTIGADVALRALERLVPDADRATIPRPDPELALHAEKAEKAKQDHRADILDRLAKLCKTDVDSLLESIHGSTP